MNRSSDEIRKDMDTIDLRMKKLNPTFLNEIKQSLGFNEEYICETFRPSFDAAFIIIRLKNEKPEYILNLTTMKPTKTSFCQKQLEINIILRIIE